MFELNYSTMQRERKIYIDSIIFSHNVWGEDHRTCRGRDKKLDKRKAAELLKQLKKLENHPDL